MYATIMTGGLHGMESYLARVEVDCSRGLPCFEMVGLLGSEVKEARERIRVALKNADMQIPPMRITVNISPASLHKEGTSYDLPVAAGILVAQGLVPQEYVNRVMLAGELGLDGEVRPVRGILPMVLEARKQGLTRCIIPAGNLREAGLVPDIRLTGIHRLEQLEGILGGKEAGGEEGTKEGTREAACVWRPGVAMAEGQAMAGGRAMAEEHVREEEYTLDFRDVVGQEGARRAAVTAAAGFHHMLMIGPPGTGKTMIAGCIPSILPPLTEEERLEVASVRSVAGQPPGHGRPFVSLHHTVSAAAFLGGGRMPGPGAVSMAHRGVLFLDELTEFRRATLDLLRQPLEEHRVRIARSGGSCCYPADFMLVGAMNPCPCGYYPDRNRCRCRDEEIRRYLNRISGPILDRMDICAEVERVEFDGLMRKKEREPAEDSASMRNRVLEARARQERRFRDSPLHYNAQMGAEEIRRFCVLGTGEERYLEQLFDALRLSARSCHRLLRVARTLADLDGKERIGRTHLSEAACFRMAGEKYWGKE